MANLADVGTWYPDAVKMPITTGEFWPDRGEPTTAVIYHVSDGLDSRGFGQNSQNQSSFHFLIGIYSGKLQVTQFMPIEYAAWGNGIVGPISNPDMPQWIRDRINRNQNINLCTISIEHERKWPFTTPFDERILAASEKLTRWLSSKVSTLVFANGHYQIDSQRRPFCPGGPHGLLFPFSRMQAAMRSSAPAPAPVPLPLPDIQHLTAIEQYAVMHPEVGLPKEPNERTYSGFGDNRTYQIRFYEHDLLHAHQEANGVWVVGRANTGAMLLLRMVALQEL